MTGNSSMRTTSRLLIALAAFSCALPAQADEAALAARIEKMQAELDALKSELQKLKTQQATTPPPAGAPANATPGTAAAVAPSHAQDATLAGPVPEALAPGSPWVGGMRSTSPLAIFGYGEINYQNYPNNASRNEADLARAVIGFGYRFDDKTRFVSEFEWEHAVTSADDQGETAVEQFYVERSFTPTLAGRAGLFLIPSGILNVAHEPTQYFGVTRNFVETSIIPTTWREGGVGVTGITSFDLTWDAGITTGFDLANWDPTSEDGKASPLGSIHQELQLAKAANLSAYGAVNWRGYPGLLLGTSLFYGKAGQKTPDFPSQDAAVTLWEAHARWTPGPFDFQALYAQGRISDTAPYNATIVGNPTLVPEAFYGWYVQAAWYAWRKNEYQFAPFVLYQQFNTGWKYADLGAGLTPNALPTEKVTTVGASFYLNPNIVFKADYQWFSVDSDSNRFQLGVGLNF